jgi:hypothetical protein
MKLKVLITEAKKTKYNRVLEILKGKDPKVKTIGIMSGQNPMAKKSTDLDNKYLKKDLESDLNAAGLKFVRIGGKFAGIFEQSVLILNPSQSDLEKLNRKYGQWGFLWGEKFTIEPGNDTMLYEMFEMEYDDPESGKERSARGFHRAPGSDAVSLVHDHASMAQAGDDFSFIPKSSKGGEESKVGKRFNIPVYEE